MQPLTSIIIVTYNKSAYSRLCIESIRQFTEPQSYEIIVVDNHSSDGTTAWLTEQPDIQVIVNNENIGFPAGCNQGIQAAAGSSVLLLNNDTIVTPNWLNNLTIGLHSAADIGAVGAVTNACSNFQRIDCSYTNISEMLQFAVQYNHSNAALWENRSRLIGYCLLIKTAVIRKIGLLDERFSPGNYEDDDYSLRIRNAGYRLVLCRDTFIHHFGSVSFGEPTTEYTKLMETNRQKFINKWQLNPLILATSDLVQDPKERQWFFYPHERNHCKKNTAMPNRQKNRCRFVTLFPETENVHLIKDVGMIPYTLAKNFDYDSTIATYPNGSYPYLDQEVQGLKLEFISQKQQPPCSLPTEYLKHQAQNIDVLHLFHLIPRTLEWIELYTRLNPTGKIYLKLDANASLKTIDMTSQWGTAAANILNKCALISVETQELYHHINQHWPIKAAYIPNGFYECREQHVEFRDKENTILTVGRIGAPVKANEILLTAFLLAQTRLPDWKLKLAGPVTTDFQALVARLYAGNPKLTEKIILTGDISDRKRLDAEYDKAKIFCLTSRSEGFPIVFAEAAKSGCFILSSDLLAAWDITANQQFGSIFPIDDSQKLAELLIQVSQDDDRLRNNCPAIQQFARETFHWDIACRTIHERLFEPQSPA